LHYELSILHQFKRFFAKEAEIILLVNASEYQIDEKNKKLFLGVRM
jgi:hypothetical protein